MKLIDTSVLYDDGTKSEIYTDTVDIKTAKYKVVPYEFDYHLNQWTEKFFYIYKRCESGMFGNHVFKDNGKGKKFKTVAECEEAIETI